MQVAHVRQWVMDTLVSGTCVDTGLCRLGLWARHELWEQQECLFLGAVDASPAPVVRVSPPVAVTLCSASGPGHVPWLPDLAAHVCACFVCRTYATASDSFDKLLSLLCLPEHQALSIASLEDSFEYDMGASPAACSFEL